MTENPNSNQSQFDATPILLDLSGSPAEQSEARHKLAKSLQSPDQPKLQVIVKGLSEIQRKTAISLASSLWSEERDGLPQIPPDVVFEPI